MEELVKAIAAKAGISEEAAKSAAQAAVDFFKDKLPEPLKGQIDSLLGGGSAPTEGGMLGSIGDALGGLLGKK